MFLKTPSQYRRCRFGTVSPALVAFERAPVWGTALHQALHGDTTRPMLPPRAALAPRACANPGQSVMGLRYCSQLKRGRTSVPA